VGHGVGLAGQRDLDLGDAQVLAPQGEARLHGDDLLEHGQRVAGVAPFERGHGFLEQLAGLAGNLVQRGFFHGALLIDKKANRLRAKQ